MFRKKTKSQQTSPSDIAVPNGVAIVADGLYFFVMGGKKYQIISDRILQSQAYPRIVPVTAAAANRIPNAKNKIGFREGSLIKDISDSAVYFISDGLRRKVVSPDFYLYFDPNSIIVASHEETILHMEGKEIGRL